MAFTPVLEAFVPDEEFARWMGLCIRVLYGRRPKLRDSSPKLKEKEDVCWSIIILIVRG